MVDLSIAMLNYQEGKDGITSHSLMFRGLFGPVSSRNRMGHHRPWTNFPEKNGRESHPPPQKNKFADSRIPITFQDLLGNLTADAVPLLVSSSFRFLGQILAFGRPSNQTWRTSTIYRWFSHQNPHLVDFPIFTYMIFLYFPMFFSTFSPWFRAELPELVTFDNQRHCRSRPGSWFGDLWRSSGS